MYAGVVLGGMGSILGAFWGGLTIGLGAADVDPGAALSAAEHRDLRVFLIIVFFRPQGMFGRVWERT
jgi:branched-chain amino acid transport system permease protein